MATEAAFPQALLSARIYSREGEAPWERRIPGGTAMALPDGLELRIDAEAAALADAHSWDETLRARVREVRLAPGIEDPAALQPLAAFPSLQALSLGGGPLNPEILPGLPELPALRHLDLSGHALSATEAESLARLPELRSLVLEDALLRAEGVEPIGQLSSLRTLSLSGSEVEGPWLRMIAPMDTLEELRFPASIRGSDLALLTRFPRLRVLWMPETLLAGGLPVSLRAVTPGLHLLALPPDLEQGEAARRIAGLTELRHLIYEAASLGRDAMTAIAALPELRTAILGAPADKEAAAALASAPRLERLQLAPAPISPEVFATLTGLQSLKSLHIGSPLLTDDSSGALEVPGGLAELHVTSSSLTPEGLQRLAARLAPVKVGHTPHWIPLPRLPREGQLFARPVGAYRGEDWKPLAATRHGLLADAFTQLSYRQNGGGTAGIAILRGGALLQLVEMQLRAVSFGEPDPLLFAPFRHVQTLELTHCDLSPRLLVALSRLASLRKLVLDFTDLMDGMAAALAQLPRLEYLDVRATRITGAGLEAIARSTRLKEINAEGCPCTPEEAAVLRERFPGIAWKGLPE